MIGTAGDLIAFAAGRGAIIDAGEAPVLLQSATDYLNRQNWVGEQADLLQDDAWPRINFYSPGAAFIDGNDAAVGIVKGEYITDPVTPKAVISAAYQLAIVAIDTDLNATVGQAETTRETVGPITVEYAESTLGGDVSFSWWDSLLGPFVLDDGNFAGNFDVYRG